MRRILFAALLIFAHGAAAEDLRIALVKASSSGSLFLAIDRGYFAAEGFDVRLVPFEAAPPVAVAVLTGKADFGVSALTAGFYNLAGAGELKLIAGQIREVPGYRDLCYAASDRAFAGLKAPRFVSGHSVAIAGLGAPAHYALGLLAEKYGFGLQSVRLVTLSSAPNIVTALAGNRVDAAILAAAPCLAASDKGAARLIGWVGDETPWQAGGVFATARTADDRADFVARFIRAYCAGANDYHAAFSAPDGTRRDGPDAAAALAVIAKYTDEPAAQIDRALGFVDAQARFDAGDILRQIAWYKSQGLVKDATDGAALVDARYVDTLPPARESGQRVR